MIKRSYSTTIYFLIASIIFLIIDISEIVTIKIMLPFILISLLMSPSLFGIMFSSLTVSLFIDDRQNGLLEFLIAEGVKPRKIYCEYVLAFLLISIPITVIVSVILGLLVRNLYYMILILINSIGISWVIIPPSLYLSYLQKIAGSSRSPLGTYIGFIILLSYIYSGTIIKSAIGIQNLMSYAGITILLIAILLTIVIGYTIKSEKLIP
jgi:hypothetical protein